MKTFVSSALIAAIALVALVPTIEDASASQRQSPFCKNGKLKANNCK